MPKPKLVIVFDDRAKETGLTFRRTFPVPMTPELSALFTAMDTEIRDYALRQNPPFKFDFSPAFDFQGEPGMKSFSFWDPADKLNTDQAFKLVQHLHANFPDLEIDDWTGKLLAGVSVSGEEFNAADFIKSVQTNVVAKFDAKYWGDPTSGKWKCALWDRSTNVYQGSITLDKTTSNTKLQLAPRVTGAAIENAANLYLQAKIASLQPQSQLMLTFDNANPAQTKELAKKMITEAQAAGRDCIIYVRNNPILEQELRDLKEQIYAAAAAVAPHTPPLPAVPASRSRAGIGLPTRSGMPAVPPSTGRHLPLRRGSSSASTTGAPPPKSPSGSPNPASGFPDPNAGLPTWGSGGPDDFGWGGDDDGAFPSDRSGPGIL